MNQLPDMAVNPDPRTLLLPDPTIIPSILSGKLPAIFSAGAFATGIAIGRYIGRRPILSGIQTYFIAAAIGGVPAYYYTKIQEEYSADRDAALRHYIELHPEDFPPPNRKRVGEVFESFYPVR